MKKILKIGLTGGIGAGKSTVLSYIGNLGVPVLQTDSLGHGLLKIKKIQNQLVKIFGRKILSSQDGIDRKRLAAEVFRDRRNQRILNELLHPPIRKGVSLWVKRQNRKGFPLVVVEVPLLFERGYNRSFDGVLCVSTPRNLRRKRLLERGWNLEEIKRREKSQWTQTQKKKRADWIIDNRGSPRDLRWQVQRWVEKLWPMAAAGAGRRK